MSQTEHDPTQPSAVIPSVDDGDDGLRAQFIADVRAGLCRAGQKTLPPRHLYDALGSALFEAITVLPEYGLTRADERVLTRCAGQLRERLGPDPLIVELGSGSGRKTRLILNAFAPRPRYAPIDISSAALLQCEKELSPLAEVRPIHDSYVQGVARASAARRPGQPLLLLFLGSTIGNFDPHEAQAFLAGLRAALRPGDALLLGADLRKPPPVLLRAYDDPTGVTAAFNRNVLGRVNRELGGDFDLAAFAHEARYDEPLGRVEMHLVARRDMKATIAAAGVTIELRAGESIWTESSHKFSLSGLRALCQSAGLRCVAEWADEEWPFVEALCIPG